MKMHEISSKEIVSIQQQEHDQNQQVGSTLTLRYKKKDRTTEQTEKMTMTMMMTIFPLRFVRTQTIRCVCHVVVLWKNEKSSSALLLTRSTGAQQIQEC